MRDPKIVVENTQELADPILVVGCQRSGTTVLGRTVSLSEAVCYLEEMGSIGDVYPTAAPLVRTLRRKGPDEPAWRFLKAKLRLVLDALRQQNRLWDMVVQMVQHAKLPQFDLKPSNKLIDRYKITLSSSELDLVERLYAKYRTLVRQDAERAFRILLKDFQILCNVERVLLKTPSNVFLLPTIKRVFPEAKVCHILRNGRDVAASYMKTFAPVERHFDHVRFICRIHSQALAVDRQQKESPLLPYLSVEYEDLLEKPEEAIQRVFAFFGLPYSQVVRDSIGQIKPTPSNWDGLSPALQKRIDASLKKFEAGS